ncbi:MAG: alpha/beta hydrolase, partial [Lachnospiraceae bacterium]|nr:alpha/beta hydrolase [Lachnospiraceae bacterium]
FYSADEERTKIHGVKWMPEGEPVAVMQLCHGMCEYIERYDEFAEFLNSKGFAVLGHDHIGHGNSVKHESERGIMHTQKPAEICVEDIFSNYKIAKGQYPKLPYFILGHSMGSYLLRMFLTLKASELREVNGAVIMGTGNVEHPTANLGLCILKTIARLRGWEARVPFVAKLQYNASYKGFSTDGSEPEKSWLSTNVESVKKYYSDEKDNFSFSLNGYRLLLSASGFTGREKNIAKINKELPILFVSGEDDPVGDLGTGMKKAYEKYQKAGIRDVSMYLFENMRHEILQEVERQRVFDYIYDWLRERM